MPFSGNGVPQHRQLYEILKGHILEGGYQPGDLLPSENALCLTYNVTRPTVRQALNSLLSEGFIKKRQGKGSIVQAKKSGIGVLSIVSRPGIGILSSAGTTDSIPAGALETRVIEPPFVGPWQKDFDFPITEMEEASGCIRMARLRLIEGKPVLYEITNLPNINLPRGEQKIRALKAEGPICDLLRVRKGQPVLHLQKRYETNRPYFHFYTAIWSNTDDYYLQGAF
ncbi:MAG: GntR family transcriptional regulator [Haliscomenobacter sp.]|nr:GntR family transcriptional regulator [Haliscomenobacter sp.]